MSPRFAAGRHTGHGGNPAANWLGVVNDGAEFALWLSPHILASTGRVLATVLKTPEEVDEYLQVPG